MEDQNKIVESGAQLRTINFHGDEIVTFERNGEPYVALRPLVEGIGLNWSGQFLRVRRDPVLGPVVCVTQTVGQDGKVREMTSLPVSMLSGFLFKIDANRVRKEVREKVTVYQRECYAALNAYWTKGVAIRGDMEGVVTDMDAAVMKRLGGMMKAIVHKELAAVVPELIEQEIATRHLSVTRGVTASQVLDMIGLENRKGLRGLATKVSNRLRRYHIERGVSLKLGTLGPTTRYLYDPLASREWLENGGKASIDRWVKEKQGQQRLKLVQKTIGQ